MNRMSCDAAEIIVLVDEAPERLMYAVSVAAWRELQSEWGGLLFGRVFTSGGMRVVWLAAAVPGLGSGTPVSFEIEPRSYELAQRLLRKDPHAQGLEEIGFWHSHPRIRVQPSSTDEEYHRLTFPAPGSLSIIIDPFAPAIAVYANTDAGIAPVSAYAFDTDGFGPAPPIPHVRPWDLEDLRDALV